MLYWLSIVIVILLVSNKNILCEKGVCEDDGTGICSNSETAAQVKVAKGANDQGKPPEVSSEQCQDRSDLCPQFARQGECTKNPGWMIINCPHACEACHMRDPKVRCDRNFLNISTTPIYQPGDMDDMFRSITRDFSSKYNVNVMSDSPWVVLFEDFLSDEEADALITTVEGTWERSTDTGATNAFGEAGRTLSTGRTSSNAWCRSNCESNPHVQNVMKKIEEITRIPRNHYESFQVLQYEVGQKYNVHHDMGLRQNRLSCGPRILTFYLYLSDVEEGGETNFPRINIAVKPKRGRAVLWPSTMNDNLEAQDPRTHHEARPVIKGKKYGANAWIHLYDFAKSNLWGCTGSFDYI